MESTILQSQTSGFVYGGGGRWFWICVGRARATAAAAAAAATMIKRFERRFGLASKPSISTGLPSVLVQRVPGCTLMIGCKRISAAKYRRLSVGSSGVGPR